MWFQVFHRREDDTEDFYKSWSEYERGFGDAASNYWLGERWEAFVVTLLLTLLLVNLNGSVAGPWAVFLLIFGEATK